MTSYQAAAGNHSIEQAVVGIRLFEDAKLENFEKAIGVADSLKERFNLPGRLKLDPLALMGRHSITGGYKTQIQLQPGFVFQLVNNDGSMNQELTVEPGAVTFRTRNYNRWSDIEECLKGLLAPVSAALSDDDIAKLSLIELRCVDQFISPKSSSAPLMDLVNLSSPLVAPYLLQREGLLHSHIGWFEEESSAGRTLVNLNIDLGEDDSRGRIASVLQVISRQSSGSTANFFGDDSWIEVLLSNFRRLHGRDKALLGNVLREEIVKAINLEGLSGVQDL